MLNCHSLQRAQEDIASVLLHPYFDVNHTCIQIVYDEEQDRFFLLIGNYNSVDIYTLYLKKKKPFRKKEMLQLYFDYKEIFEASQLGIKDSDAFYKSAVNTWRLLYNLLFEPFAEFQHPYEKREIFCKTKLIIDGIDISFNMSILFDVGFRFKNKESNESTYFVHIQDRNFYSFFDEYLKINYPQMKDLVLLNGIDFDPLVSKKKKNKLSEEESKRQLLSQMFCCAVSFLKSQGGQLKSLYSIEDFEQLFDKTNERVFIQLFTHFHKGLLTTKNNNIIWVNEISEIIEQKKSVNSLNDKIILDASTCRNIDYFKVLREKGLKYICYSYNNLYTLLNLITLSEMYSGILATEINWPFPYLNGKNHIHQVYSDIRRIQYITMNNKGKINLSNYEKAIAC